MGKTVYGLLLIVGTLLGLAFPAPKTIVFFGDSLTAGYGLDPKMAFPQVVKEKLIAAGRQVNIINAGLSGETTAGGASRIDWILRQPVDIFVLELGGNDGLRGLPLEQTEKNLQLIIDKVRAKNPQVKIIIAGMQVPPNLGEDYTEKFSKIFPRISSKNKATLLPFLLEGVAGDEKLNLPDGIHPNAEGHKVVADNIIRVLRPLL